MGCVRWSEIGFLVVYLHGLWSQLSRVVNFQHDIAIILVLTLTGMK